MARDEGPNFEDVPRYHERCAMKIWAFINTFNYDARHIFVIMKVAWPSPIDRGLLLSNDFQVRQNTTRRWHSQYYQLTIGCAPLTRTQLFAQYHQLPLSEAQLEFPSF